jgi:hypothetical protein
MPDDLGRLLRIGRHRLWTVQVVRGACAMLPWCAGVALALAVVQRLGWVDVQWALLGPGLGVVLLGGGIVIARPWTISNPETALSLDEGLGLDDRLCTALAAHNDDGLMARRAVEQAQKAVVGLATRRMVRRALPLRGNRSLPWCLVAVLVAFVIAGEPASRVMAAEARDRVEVELALAIDAVSPLAVDDQDIADAIEAAQAPMPELATPQEVELEALRRITELQDALEQVLDREDVRDAQQAAEALRGMPAATSGQADVDAMRKALREGDFAAGASALEQLAKETAAASDDDPISTERREALEALARDLEQAARRAQAMAEEDAASGKPASMNAAEALDELAEDVQECASGQCDNPSSAERCQSMSKCQKAGECATKGQSACATAASNCNGPNPGAGKQGNGLLLEDAAAAIDPSVVSHPHADSIAGAEVVDVQSAPGGSPASASGTLLPVSVDGATTSVPNVTSPESLRRLPARYQDAVRRFFGSTDAKSASQGSPEGKDDT